MCLKNATKLRSGTLTVTLQTHVQESKSSIGQIGRFLRYWVLPSLRGSRCPRLRGPDCSLCAQTLANQTRKKVPRAIRVGGALQGRRPPSLPRRRCGPTLSDGPSPSLCWWALQIVASQKKRKKILEQCTYGTELFFPDSLPPQSAAHSTHRDWLRARVSPRRVRPHPLQGDTPSLSLPPRPPAAHVREARVGSSPPTRRRGPSPPTPNVPRQNGKNLATFIPHGPPTPRTATGQPVTRPEFWSEPPVPRLVIRALHDGAVACLRQQGVRQTDKHENGSLAGGLSTIHGTAAHRRVRTGCRAPAFFSLPSAEALCYAPCSFSLCPESNNISTR